MKLHLKEPNGRGVQASDEIVNELCLLLRHCIRSVSIFGWRLTDAQKTLIQEKLDGLPDASQSVLKVTVGDQYTSKQILVPGRFDDYVEKLLADDSFIISEIEKFARSANGLKLSASDIGDIQSDYQGRAYERRNAYFRKWRVKNGNRDTAVRDLKKMVAKYHNHNQTCTNDE